MNGTRKTTGGYKMCFAGSVDFLVSLNFNMFKHQPPTRQQRNWTDYFSFNFSYIDFFISKKGGFNQLKDTFINS